MGTNYYLQYNICKHCGRFDSVHIGKASVGWKFMFQEVTIVNPPIKKLQAKNLLKGENEFYIEIKSGKDWIDFIKKHVINNDAFRIVDEYGSIITPKDFLKLVEAKSYSQSQFDLNIINEGPWDFCTEPFS